jgi:hypothetical protein
MRGLVVAALLTAGCAGSSPAAPPAITGDGGLIPDASGGAIPDGGSAQLGGFAVALVAATETPPVPAFTSITGKVYDGPSPPTVVWEAQTSSGGCTLYAVKPPFCGPSCGGEAACVATNTCVPYPRAQNLGTVTVTGVGAPVTLISVANNYQAPPRPALPYPPAAEGAAITVQASSGPLGAFSVTSGGVAPLGASGPVALESGKPLHLAWTPPGRAGTVVEVKLDISHHGGTRSKIECTAPDSGSLDISAPLITGLVSLGVAGFPGVSLTRVSEGRTQVPAGLISLRVTSTADLVVNIPGVTSCEEDIECPAGQKCQPDKRCK